MSFFKKAKPEENASISGKPTNYGALPTTTSSGNSSASSSSSQNEKDKSSSGVVKGYQSK